MVEVAVHALEGTHAADFVLDGLLGGHQAHAAGFVVDRLLGDQAFQRFTGDFLAHGGGDLRRVRVALGGLLQVVLEGLLEILGGDAVAVDGGHRGGVATAVQTAGDTPADEGRGQQEEEDSRDEGVGEIAEGAEHGGPWGVAGELDGRLG